MTESFIRGYKDSTFRELFNNEEAARELVNTIEGTDYGEETKVEINDLEGSIFTDLQNDVSFTLDDKLYFFVEHQSTLNPNMPYRMLRYYAECMANMYGNRNFFGFKTKEILTPEFYVVYNGKEDIGDGCFLKLSDMFADKRPGSLELVVKVIDIRYDESKEIFNKSSILKQYSRFVELTERLTAEKGRSSKTTEEILRRCEEEGILSEYLRKHGGGAVRMAYERFDWDEYIEQVKKDGREIGIEEGIAEGRKKAESEIYEILTERMNEAGLSEEEIKRLLDGFGPEGK